jgi:hypothetical protein
MRQSKRSTGAAPPKVSQVVDALARGCDVCSVAAPVAAGYERGELVVHCAEHSNPFLTVAGVCVRAAITAGAEELDALWDSIIEEAQA